MSEKPAFATYSGPIDNASIGKIFNIFAGATQDNFSEVHLLFQSAGGVVGDGVALHNFFRGYPIPLHIYNAGTVASAAVSAFLGAQHRYISSKATFVIHKTFVLPPQTPHRGPTLEAWVHTLAVDDARSEAILREQTSIPEAKWAAHAVGDVTLDAAESVEFGLAQAVREWQVPAGQRVFNI